MQPDNYFVFYDIPIAFTIDEAKLKQQFYTYSKQFHPDFYTQKTEAEQEYALELSVYNNKAYKVLSNFDSRMQYILQLKGVIIEGEKYNLPPDFLMEMMEINENLMKLETAPDTNKLNNLQQQISSLTQTLNRQLFSILNSLNNEFLPQELLLQVKEIYYKKKYLLRIQNSLRNFVKT